MGQSYSGACEPPETVSLKRACESSSNPAMTSARFHSSQRRCCLHDHYEVGSELVGKGTCSSVVAVRCKVDTRRTCAMKVYRYEQLPPEAAAMIVAEVEILLSVDHPNIVRVYDVYEQDAKVSHVVMESCSGGDLYSRLLDVGRFAEVEAAEATRQVLAALIHLHRRQIVHRDIKLEHCMYATPARECLKLIDFGFATLWDGSSRMYASCGTCPYVAPEILLGTGYTCQADLWSLGILVFMLLTGSSPIRKETGEGQNVAKSRIKRGSIEWNLLDMPVDVALSMFARKFVRALLTLDLNYRITAHLAASHVWLQQPAHKPIDPHAKMFDDMLQSLKRYAQSPRLRRLTLQLLARHVSISEESKLASIFASMCDEDGGNIDMKSLSVACSGNVTPQHSGGSSKEVVPDRESAGGAFAWLNLLSVLDVNRDGQVYYSDFLAATADTFGGFDQEALQLAFQRLDVDGDGKLAAADLRAVLLDDFEGSTAEDILAEVDLNGSAMVHVDFETFALVMDGTTIGDGRGNRSSETYDIGSIVYAADVQLSEEPAPDLITKPPPALITRRPSVEQGAILRGRLISADTAAMNRPLLQVLTAKLTDSSK